MTSPATIIKTIESIARLAASFKEHVVLEMHPVGVMIKIDCEARKGYVIRNRRIVSWNSIELSNGNSLMVDVKDSVMEIRERLAQFGGFPPE